VLTVFVLSTFVPYFAVTIWFFVKTTRGQKK
jgi:hypothetical protein